MVNYEDRKGKFQRHCWLRPEITFFLIVRRRGFRFLKWGQRYSGKSERSSSLPLSYYRLLSIFTDTIFYSNFTIMRPDYPHKLFNDHRNHFNLLMETLAMDAVPAE